MQSLCDDSARQSLWCRARARLILLMVVSTQQDWDTAAWHVQVARHRLAARVGWEDMREHGWAGALLHRGFWSAYPQHVVDMAKDCGGDEAHFVDHYAANVVQAHAAFAKELGTSRRHGDVRELPHVACVLARDAQRH